MSSSAIDSAFSIFLITSAFLCTAVFGMVLLFAIVAMPGLALLDDGEFLRCFQVMDGVIQRNQPIFLFFLIGSVLSLLVTMGIGIKVLDNNVQLALLIVATFGYLAGQVTTFAKNVPLNNRVQELNISYMDDDMKKLERDNFEDTWNLYNWFRTIVFGLVSIYLCVLLLLTESAF